MLRLPSCHKGPCARPEPDLPSSGGSLTGLQNHLSTCADQSQNTLARPARAWAQSVQRLSSPFSTPIADPTAVVDVDFDLAEQVLATQRELTKAVLRAVAPWSAPERRDYCDAAHGWRRRVAVEDDDSDGRDVGMTATTERPRGQERLQSRDDDAGGTGLGALEAVAVEAVLGANPFVGLSSRQVVAAAGRLLTRLGLRPRVVARHSARLARDLVVVVAGHSDIAPAKGDKRWSDPAWQENPAYRRVQQTYLAVCATLDHAIGDAGLDVKSDLRGRFAMGIVTEALAPTNTLLNPSVVKRAFDTGGLSLLRGARHLVSDVRFNGGMPRTVDTRPFVVGETLATTPGAVVFRNDVLELIQYAPVTEMVGSVPLVYVPPQINKYYILDLAPGRSLIEHMVGSGVTWFTVSWRNPGKEQGSWDLSTYAGALLEALDAVEEITGSPSAHLLGMCAGGMTGAALLGHLEATGRLDRIRSLTLLVNMLDTTAPSTLGSLASRRSIDAAVAKARRQGVHSGRDMSRLFAWLRPNDLVWNYAINNWLLGQDPPAFDVLAWNADCTELPAALYEQYLQMYEGNLLREPGGLTILGTPIDLSKVDLDVYCMAGSTDHIVTWRAAYQTTQVVSGHVEFVLSNAGHIQSMVNPVGGKKASFRVGEETGPDPDAWFAASRSLTGSWWEHWDAWLRARSDGDGPAPSALGSTAHPPLDPAPGRYVLDSGS